MSRLYAALQRAQDLEARADRQPDDAAPRGAAPHRLESDGAPARALVPLAAPADRPAVRAPLPGAVATSPVSAPVRVIAPTSEKLVVCPSLDQSTIEQYRKLAASLHRAQMTHDLKIVMVSSAMTGDGKSLTSTNLALTLSESYRRRVLLIDADLRKPGLHEVFQVPNAAGLSDCLRDDVNGPVAALHASPCLDLILAGRPDSDPMSGLTSARMRRVLADAAETHDWVIIDTPPVVLLPDANLLSAMVDAAILVIGAGKTPFKLVARAVDALGRDKIFGVVLNRVDRSLMAGAYGYGYGYEYGSERVKP
jgi:protein-tyrosine kinase